MTEMPRAGMCNDSRRALISVAAALGAAIIGAVGIALAGGSVDRGDAWVVVLLFAWNVFALVYVVLTTKTFSGCGRDEFAARMTQRGQSRPWFWRRINPWGDGPGVAIEASLVAFAVVLIVPRVPVLDINDWILIPTCLSILLCCWALSIVSYALHYAEKDLAEPCLNFPGSRTHAFADYTYFSITVATTFGATDVAITTPYMRRVVNFHTVLTFFYNSVIVALLVALLIR